MRGSAYQEHVQERIERLKAERKEHLRKQLSKMRVNFFDRDLALLFCSIPETSGIAIHCALYVQYLDRMPYNDQGWHIGSTNDLIRKYLPFMRYDQLKVVIRRLKKLGILETRYRCKRLRPKKIVALAKKMKALST